MKKSTRDRITESLQKAWPQTQAEVAQLEFEGARWYDEGTHVALIVWDPAREKEVVAATMAFNLEGDLEELEESFVTMHDLILDEGL